MKKIYLLIMILALPVMMFSQKTFPTKMSFTFSGGNNMGKAIGNDCGLPTNDVDIQFNSIDGNMEISVNKICHSWSFVQHWMGNPYAASIVFKNRFIELRCLSSAVAPGLSIAFQVSGGNPNGSIGKSIPKITYNITEAETWQVKFFKVGGTADTVFKEIDYNFPNGFYKFDYVYYGDAAVPPVPTIDVVKAKNVQDCAGPQNVSLTGIEIPGRLYDGLKITAEAKSDGFLKDISILDLGGGSGIYIDEENKSATLQYTPIKGMAGMSDSIIVSLEDTIRSIVKKMAFKVTLLACTTDLADMEDKISVYPSVTSGIISLDFPELFTGEITIVDIIGNVVSSTKMINQASTKVDLSAVPSGIYIVKISDGTTVSTRKVVRD